MELVDFDLDWHSWFERWEAMQNCYIPHRLSRFDLMLQLASLPRNGDVEILDLGCGPGSLAFRAVRYYPNAHIVAVDFDPILLTMGQKEAEKTTHRIDFVQADIRRAKFWQPYQDAFDLIMSATALHWLNAENLAQTYKRSHKALKLRGCLMNSDHVSSNDPEMQGRYRQILQANQQTAFRESGADDWDAFWDKVGFEARQADLAALRNADEYWEGSEDGQPKQCHFDALRDCGFEQVECHWQYLGEAIIGARKRSERVRA